MARARNIKPSFFTSEQIADQCPLGRLLFIGLWTLADFKGELEWKERTIKLQVLGFDNCDVKALAINLDKSGLIRFYSDGSRIFINIPNFEKHQNPHKNEREKGSDIPAYTEKQRQYVDISTLAINRDKSGAKPSENGTHPADSLLLNPDSRNLKPETPARDARDLFAEFWEAFPNDLGNKGSKADAEKAFQKLKPDKALFTEIMAALSRQAQRKREIKASGQFAASFKHAHRWINKKGWTDELDQFDARPGSSGSASDAAFAEYLAGKGEQRSDYIDAEYAEIHEAAGPH